MKGILVTLCMFIFLNFNCILWAKTIKPGTVITGKNYETYLPELKRLLTSVLFKHYINGLQNGWITMPIVKKGDYKSPKGYLEFSDKNADKYKVGKDNVLIGPTWWGGAPFPDPKNGKELGWNIYRRYDCHREEFHVEPDCNLIDKNGKLERSYTNDFFGKKYHARTDTPPIPEVPGNNGFINWKIAMLVTSPFDIKGFVMLRNQYEDIFKPDDVFSYIPAIRRIRRLTGADVTDPLMGSDACYDDFECWQQKLGPEIKFGNPENKEILIPSWSSVEVHPEKRTDWIKHNCFQTEWEIRPVWVLPTDMPLDYAYSRRVFYIEKEMKNYFIFAVDNYDQKGRIWKGAIPFGVVYQPDKWYLNWHGCIYKTYTNNHTSLYDFNVHGPKFDDPIIPFKYFSVSTLIKLAK
ncbi:MAG: DUF1329 domain-containing protein [Thermodesulfobacteriota bacterium]|nr:DUF1329 domain-containing protein [Thermodesulfobacteriota bacterium]